MAILSSSCSNTNVLAIVKRLQISLYNCIFTNHLFKYMCYNECTVLEHNVSVLWRRDVYDCVCVRICTSLTNKCDNMVDEIRSSFEYFHSALRLFWASVVEPSWIIPSQTLPTPYIRERLIQYLQRHDWPSGDGLIVEGSKEEKRGQARRRNKDGVVCSDDLVDEMANHLRCPCSTSLLHIRATLEKRERTKLGTIRWESITDK